MMTFGASLRRHHLLLRGIIIDSYLFLPHLWTFTHLLVMYIQLPLMCQCLMLLYTDAEVCA